MKAIVPQSNSLARAIALLAWPAAFALAAALAVPAGAAPREASGDDSSTATLQTAPKPSSGPAVVWAKVRIGGEITELQSALSLFRAETKPIRTIVDRLDDLSKNPRIAGALLQFESPQMGFAKIEELVAAIGRFRSAGKRAVAFISSESAPGYLPATACDEIVLAPSGAVLLAGLSAEAFFFKDLFDKIGVQGDFVAMGKYKSGAEAMTRNDWSDPARESMSSIVGDMFRQMVEIIAAGRGMDPDSIEATLDMGPFTAEDAKRFGLVDRLAYEEDYILDLAARTGVGFAIEDSEDSPRGQAALQTLNPLDFLKLLSPPQKPSRAIGRDPRIAVVYAVGPILSVDPGDPFIAQEIVTPKRVIGDLRECLADPLVRAIVLRVDSPGGDATASDLIWQEIRRIKKQKPVVASMSDTAASGGYYIAMAADKILAHPGSITGSIGVFGGKLAMGDLLGKIGVTTERIAFGENASIFSSTTPFSETEREAFRRLLARTYSEFVDKTAESRQLTAGQAEAAAKGRVWTGRQALKMGLVDELGGLSSAIADARAMSGLPSDRPFDVVIYPEERSLMDIMQRVLGGQAAPALPMSAAAAMEPLLPGIQVRMGTLLELARQPRPLALAPFWLKIW